MIQPLIASAIRSPTSPGKNQWQTQGGLARGYACPAHSFAQTAQASFVFDGPEFQILKRVRAFIARRLHAQLVEGSDSLARFLFASQMTVSGAQQQLMPVRLRISPGGSVQGRCGFAYQAEIDAAFG